jgi:hypothetical protein
MTVEQLIAQLSEYPGYYPVEVEVRTARSGAYSVEPKQVERSTHTVVIR